MDANRNAPGNDGALIEPWAMHAARWGRLGPPLKLTPSVQGSSPFWNGTLYKIIPGFPAGTRFRSSESIFCNARDFARGVNPFIRGAFAAGIGFGVMLAKINIARQFAHKFNVHFLGTLGPQRRQALQRSPQINRPEIDVQVEIFAQGE